ncbi:MAG: RhuM family protein [Pirellulales bacterium]
MGLTTWAGDKPRKADVGVAKNYLTAEEIDALNRIVTAYLEFAELQALSRRAMHMADWIAKLDDFLRLSDREILAHAGKISHEAALEKAEGEFAKYRKSQAPLPQPVDEHFEQSIEELKQIEKQKPSAPQTEGKKPTNKIPPQRTKRNQPHKER